MKNFSHFKLLLVALSAALAHFAIAAEEPAARLESTVDQVLDILAEPESQSSVDQKREKMLGVLDTQFSFDAMIKGALGRHRNELSEEEMDRITELVTDLLIRSYVNEFNNGERPKVKFKPAVELTNNKIEVPTQVSIEGKAVNLTYRLARLKSGWQVYDLIVEGVSMVRNYREQFDRHFQTKGVPELIELIKDKLEDF